MPQPVVVVGCSVTGYLLGHRAGRRCYLWSSHWLVSHSQGPVSRGGADCADGWCLCAYLLARTHLKICILCNYRFVMINALHSNGHVSLAANVKCKLLFDRLVRHSCDGRNNGLMGSTISCGPGDPDLIPSLYIAWWFLPNRIQVAGLPTGVPTQWGKLWTILKKTIGFVIAPM